MAIDKKRLKQLQSHVRQIEQTEDSQESNEDVSQMLPISRRNMPITNTSDLKEKNSAIQYTGDNKVRNPFSSDNVTIKDKWYRQFLQNSKAFEDNDENTTFGEKTLDTAKTIGATGAEIIGRFNKSFSDAGDAIAENASRAYANEVFADEINVKDLLLHPKQTLAKIGLNWGTRKVVDAINGDNKASNMSNKELREAFIKGINQYHEEGGILEQGLDKINDYSVLGNTSDKIIEGMGYTWASTMGSGVLEDLGLASEITAGIGKFKVNMPIVSMLHSFNTGMAEGFTDEDKEAWEVVLNSLGEAGIDGFTEGMFGMFGVGGSSLDDALKGKVSSLCKSGFMKAIAQTGMSAIGEGTEELASYLLEYTWHNGVMANLDKAMNGTDISDWEQAFNSEEMWEAFWTSAISSAFSNGIDVVNNVSKSANNIIQEEEQRKGRKLTEEERTKIKQDALYNEMYISEEEALGNLSRENKEIQAERETAYLYNQIEDQARTHTLELDEEGNEIEQEEEELSPAEERINLRKEIQDSDLSEGEKKQLLTRVNENSDLDEIRRTEKDLDRLNKITKFETTTEQVINESNITNEQKEKLINSFESGQINANQAVSLLSKYETQTENQGEILETSENQGTTIENERLLESAQQTTQNNGETAQNQSTQEIEENGNFEPSEKLKDVVYDKKLPKKDIKPTKEGYVVLYHNTNSNNLSNISKEGLKGGQRLEAYGKGSEAEGSGIWATIKEGSGYGGSTVAIQVPQEVAEKARVNNDEYILYDDILPEDVLYTDKLLTSDKGLGTVKVSDIPQQIDKFGYEKVRKTFASKNILTEEQFDEIAKAYGYDNVDINQNESYNIKQGENKNTTIQSMTVAPYYDTEITNENFEEIKNKVDTDFRTKAETITNLLGGKIANTNTNIGAYEFQDNEKVGHMVHELSYTFDLGDVDSDSADLIASLLGDLGHEQQETVIASNYTNDGTGNSVETTINLNSIEGVRELLEKNGIKDYTIDTNNKQIKIYSDTLTDDTKNTVVKLMEELGENFNGAEWNETNSRFLGEDARARMYETWLKNHEGEQDGELYKNVSEANRKVQERLKNKKQTTNNNENSQDEGSFSLPEKVELPKAEKGTTADLEIQKTLAQMKEANQQLQNEIDSSILTEEEIEQENMRAQDLGLLLNARMEDELGELYSLKNNIGKSQGKMNKQQEKDRTTRILSKAPSKVKRQQRIWGLIRASVIDKGAIFEDMDLRSGDLTTRRTQSAYQNLINANKDAEYAIGNKRYIFNNGEQTEISDSLYDIKKKIPEEDLQEFNEYAYHWLNVDRMTLDETARKKATQIEDELDKLRLQNELSPNEDFKEIERQAKKKIEFLNNIKNKEVMEKEGKTVTAEESVEIINDIEARHPEFIDILQEVYRFLDANNQHLKNNGVISQDTIDLFKELYPHYVPINRVNEFGEAIRVPLRANETTINTPIRRAKGGTEDIAPLFETIADRTRQTYKASARNNLGQAIFQKLGALNEIQADINNNVDIEELIDNDADSEMLIKESANSTPQLVIFNNGQRIKFNINDDIYDALKAPNEILQKLDNTRGAKLLQGASKLRRGLLTEYNPLFLVTNGIKDAQDVLLNSQHPLKTYAKFAESYAQIVKKGYWYQEYMQNGGFNQSLFKDGEFDEKALEKLGKEKNWLEKIGGNIANANQIIELAPRLAEYIASREMGRDVQTSMLDSARVTTNFSAGGDYAKFLNRNGFTFLNANIQGMAQQFRNIRESSHKGIRGLANLIVRGAIASAPLALLNGIIWKDDEDYENLSDYIKDSYYIVGKKKDGTFVRIPKGRALASIQKAVGDVYNMANGNQDVNIESLIDTITEDIKFTWKNVGIDNPASNHLLAPAGQVLTNNAWYGGDIVPSRLQNEDIENITDEGVDKFSNWLGKQIGKSETASTIAKRLNINPITINYLLDQYSGVVGDIALPALTPEVRHRASNPLLIPVADKFTADPTLKNQASTDYYTMKDKLEGASKKSNATDEDKVKYQFLSSYGKEMSELYSKKREIQNSDSQNKFDQVKKVQDEINSLMKKNMEEVDKAKIDKDTATVGDKMYYKNNDGDWKEVKEDAKPKGLSLQKYAKFKNDMSTLTDKKREETGKETAELNQTEKITYLKNGNYSKREKEMIYSSMIKSKSDMDYDNLKMLSNSLDIDGYLDYKLQDFSNEDDPNSNVKGKTVKNSGKNNFIGYLNNSGFSNIEMTYLYGNKYKMSNSQMRDFQKYMNDLGLTDEEQRQVVLDGLSKSNVIEYEDGTWEWKYNK